MENVPRPADYSEEVECGKSQAIWCNYYVAKNFEGMTKISFCEKSAEYPIQVRSSVLLSLDGVKTLRTLLDTIIEQVEGKSHGSRH